MKQRKPIKENTLPTVTPPTLTLLCLSKRHHLPIFDFTTTHITVQCLQTKNHVTGDGRRVQQGSRCKPLQMSTVFDTTLQQIPVSTKLRTTTSRTQRKRYPIIFAIMSASMMSFVYTRIDVTTENNQIALIIIQHIWNNHFYSASAQLAMQSAVLAIVNPSVHLSVCPSVCLSVRHTLALSQNDSSYDHGVFTGGQPHMTLVCSTLDFTAKFQREHGERGRRMREGQEKQAIFSQ